jgi:hypothetical protein
MGFLDKVKSAAQDVAQEAKKATATAQSKMEQSQIRKKINEAAEKLGYLIYRERTGGTPAGAEADQLVSEMTSLEAQLQEEAASPQAAAGAEAAPDTSAPSPPTPPASTSASEPTSGDFKL